MTVKEFRKIMEQNPGANMHWMLPDRTFVPDHYHITEVGRVDKDFIDCGGTVRSKKSCTLQMWVADDTDHRLETDKLFKIMDAAQTILRDEDLPMEVEFEDGTISQYPIGGMEITPKGPLFYLGLKHTECLAPEKCMGGGCCKR